MRKKFNSGYMQTRDIAGSTLGNQPTSWMNFAIHASRRNLGDFAGVLKVHTDDWRIKRTALFNWNPLMRFDGYFIRSDLVGIPHLYQEGGKAVSPQTRWLRLATDDHRFCATPKTAQWVAVYGWLAWV